MAFKTIEEKDIFEIEKFMRTNSSLSFNFRPGDIKLIEALVAHVKRMIDTNGLAHFSCGSNIDKQMAFLSIDDQKKNINEIKTQTQTQYLLKSLLSAADRNANRKEGGYRYDPEVKHYAALLRMIAGPFAYEILQRNLKMCLPSLPSTNRYIRSSNCHISEGILRCEELAFYLAERSLEPVVCLSEDATRITGRVQYDAKSNQLVGFVLPLNEQNGLPIPFMFPARNAEEILNSFSENQPAHFLNVIMAQPIANVPAFCLMVFGSDNKYTGEDVANRWDNITKQLAKVNVKVLTISSDSDPKYNKAMRLLSKLGHKTDFAWFSSYLNPNGPFFIQDIIHLLTKLRNFLLRTLYDKRLLPFGNGFIRIEHLYELLNMFTKDRHQLTASTLNPVDRQNFRSVLRICHKRVSNLLRDHIEESNSTIQFLQIMRDIIDGFMDHNLTPLQRIRKIWYNVFLVRIWRHFILLSKEYTLKDNFLSSNCYSCIELNAHNLILCILHLKKINKPELFKPFLYESQACESQFRQLRSMSTVFSTVTNCSVKEAISRISKIQYQNEIMQRTSQHFEYPGFNKPSFPESQHTLPTADEIIKEIEFCQELAKNTAKKLGLIERRGKKNYECKIKLATTNASQRKKKKSHISFAADPIQLTANDLKNIQLKNYAAKIKPNAVDGTGPYVSIKCSDRKIVAVKKTSLCWLLGVECKKLSSDRLLRVMHTKKKLNIRINKHIPNHSLLSQKRMNKRKRKT